MRIAFKCPICKRKTLNQQYHKVDVTRKISLVWAHSANSTVVVGAHVSWPTVNKLVNCSIEEYVCNKCGFVVPANNKAELIEWLISKDMMRYDDISISGASHERYRYFTEGRSLLIANGSLTQAYINNLYPYGEPTRP